MYIFLETYELGSAWHTTKISGALSGDSVGICILKKYKGLEKLIECNLFVVI